MSAEKHVLQLDGVMGRRIVLALMLAREVVRRPELFFALCTDVNAEGQAGRALSKLFIAQFLGLDARKGEAALADCNAAMLERHKEEIDLFTPMVHAVLEILPQEDREIKVGRFIDEQVKREAA